MAVILLPSQQDRFNGTRVLYEEAMTCGLIKAQIAPPLGGTSGSFVEAVLLVKECYAVNPSGASRTEPLRIPRNLWQSF
jgi:hypothetical protein